MSLSFVYQFKVPSAAQKYNKANFNLEVWSENGCVMSIGGWAIKEGKNGLYAQGPQYTIGEGNDKKYKNHVFMFPGKGDESEKFKAFQQDVIAAYNAWVEEGRTEGDAGRSLVTAAPQVQTAPAVALPAGWITNIDANTQRRYYMSPQGELLWEGDPKLSTLFAKGPTNPEFTIPAQAAAPAGNPFKGGSVNPFKRS